MRKIVLLFSLLIPLAHAVTSGTTIANTLASYDFIVDNSKNPAGYRLGDTITRAEAVGVALRVGEIELPEKYFCKNYFRDVAYNPVNNWICRAIEIAADENIISRENSTARPATPISRIEALAITMRAGKVPYARNVARTNYPQSMPQWQVDLLEGALQYQVISSTQNFGPDLLATRIDVFGMIYNMRFAGTKMEYITDRSDALPPLGSAPDGRGGIVVTLPGSQTNPPENTVIKSPLAGFAVTAPTEVKINTPFDITVRALAHDTATLTSHTGTLYFDLLTGATADTSGLLTDEGFLFTEASKGSVVIKNVVIKKAGKYEFDAYEIGSGFDILKTFTITATEPVVPASTQLSDITVSAPKDVVTNTPFSITVTAMNSSGQTMTNYVGTIYFGTTGIAGNVEFPNGGSYTFTAADKGKKVFSGFKLKLPGEYELLVYEVDVIPNGTKRTVKITAKAN